MNNRVELSTRARKDLKKTSGDVRAQLVAALRTSLEANPTPANANVKALVGAAPWLRLRSGDYRIIFRALTAAELKGVGAATGQEGFLVERIVNRRELLRAVETL